MSNLEQKLDPKDVEDILSLTPLQEGMLFHYISNPETPLYFEQLCLSLGGDLDPVCFREAWTFVMRTNEVLRAVFRWEKVDKPVQVILKQRGLPLGELDLSGPAPGGPVEMMAEVRKKDRERGLDLAREPFRLTLCKLAEDRHELIISSHHILYDGWSNGIILKEFITAYDTLTSGKPLAQPVKPKFKEFIKRIRSQDRDRQLAYWKEYLQGFHSKTVLPADTKKLSAISKLDTYTCRIPADINTQINNFAKDQGVTPATLLYGVWGILLQCYNDCDDVLFGTTVAGRETVIPGIEDLVGLFINTIPLRFNYDPEMEVVAAFKMLGRDLQRRAEYEMTALTDIKSAGELGKQEALFDSIMVVDNYPLAVNLSEARESGSPLRIESYSIFEMTNFDLTLQIYTFGPLELQFNYNGDLFAAPTIRRMAEHFQNGLTAICRQPRLKLKALEVLSEAEKLKLLREFNGPVVDYPKQQLIPQWIAGQAIKTPDSIAVIYEDQHLTYGELNCQANQVAAFLQSYGVQPGDMVGLLMPRSVAMITGMLGILKANAVCVPLDTEHPDERIRTILDDSGTRILLQLEGHDYLPGFDGAKPEFSPEKISAYPGLEPEVRIDSGDLAYLIYTSGSTGKPKGAMLTHAGIINHVLTKIAVLEIGARDMVGNNFSINVIAAIWQILAPLFCGARLIVYPEAVEKDPYLQFERVAADWVSIIEVIPSVLNAYLNIMEKGKPKIALPRLRKIALTSEEAKCFLVNKFYGQYPIPLVDCYGQTECSDDTLHYEIPVSTATMLVPIGRPSHNTRIYILSRHNQLQPMGIAGELCVSGDGVGLGYWNKPELTAAKFMPDPFEPGRFMYRTGDLARWDPDGLVAYLGRIDHQVKIRGNRIELGEIESQLLKHPAILETVVVAREDEQGDSYLAAFFVGDAELTVAELRGYLAKAIPDYMIPAQFVRLETMPLTPNGKIDRKRLPSSNGNIAIGNQFTPPDTVVEKQLAAIWQQILHKESLGIHDNFFDLGGHSLLLIQVKNKIQEVFGHEIPIVEMFRYPTICLLAAYLNRRENPDSNPTNRQNPEINRSPKLANPDDTAVAIIGMAGYFPGAGNIPEYWDNLLNGRETVSFFRDDELESLDSMMNNGDDPLFVKASGVLKGIDRFDAGFFGFNPREAELTDPQQRLFLKCSWEALENAGYSPDQYPGKIGVYAGVGLNTYLLNNLLPEQDSIRAAGDFQTVMGNDKDFVATRVSYKFNLKGPSVTVQTACSTSLVATYLARQGLIQGDCDMALAGAAFIRIPQKTGYLYQTGGNLSPDGHCRTFDHDAKGTVFGSGVGVVVLKRLADACKDGDQIYAVIKGSAINNDGAQKVSFTAPGVDSQAEVIAQAIAKSGVDPETIHYIEAHGTATTLGDPIEIEALTKAFRKSTPKKAFCAVGTVKTNIGHLDVAAGIAGLIKSALAIHHGIIPPSLHFNRPNPVIDFLDTPFYVNDRLLRWDSDTGPRRAGVSCFGIGGTNIHMVLEEAPRCEFSVPARPGYLLLLSARTANALKTMTQNLAACLTTNPELNLADVAYTLQVGRREFQYRRAIVCLDRTEAIRLLEELEPARDLTGISASQKPNMVFCFDHPPEIPWEMLQQLVREEPVFQRFLKRNSEHFKEKTKLDLVAILQGTTRPDPDFTDQLSMISMIWMVIEYTVIEVLNEWGIVPQALLGYRASEWIAACLAGVFSLEDALELLGAREPGKVDQTLRRIQLHSPRIPFISKITGTWIQPAEAVRPEYWIHLSQRNLITDQTQFRVEIEPDSIWLEMAAENGGNQPVLETANRFSAKITLCSGQATDLTLPVALNWLGKFWVHGAGINWNGLYRGEKRRRVSLPSYPFEEERFWIEPPKFKPSMGKPPGSHSGLVKEKDLSQWSYLPVWKQAPLIIPVQAEDGIPPDTIWLLFTDSQGLGAELQRMLLLKNHRVITVNVGIEFTKIDPGSYSLNPRAPEHYRILFQELSHDQQLPDRIIHLWNVAGTAGSEADFEKFLDYQYLGFYSLLFLAQMWHEQVKHKKVSVTVVSDGTHDLNGPEGLIPDKTTIWGACTVISQEYPAISCRCIDVSHGDLQPDRIPGFSRQIYQEIGFCPTVDRIAYRWGQRWIQTYEKTGLPASGPVIPAVLRHQGVYLITGGLGNIGLKIAGYLAGAVQAKLILVGRSFFPARNQWDEWLRQHPAADSRSMKIHEIRRLESLGAEVLTLNSDISDAQAAQSMITAARERFGGIHGVFHAAGFTGAEAVTLVAETDPRTSEKQFLPKVKGLMNLAAILERETMDFWVLISSLASVLGGLGSAAYAAANIFMDGFARQRDKSGGGRFISINWDAWRFESTEAKGLALDRTAMEAEEAIAILERILARDGFSQLIISTADLDLRRRQSLSASSNANIHDPSAPTTVSGYGRPELSTAYLPANNRVEAILCEVWEELIGIHPVGIMDNFFELGGHSLMATQAISRLKDIFRIEIPIRQLFDAPNVKELALTVGELWGSLEQAEEVAATYLEFRELSAADLRKLLMNS